MHELRDKLVTSRLGSCILRSETGMSSRYHEVVKKFL